jgi:hypothetical protein
VACFTLPGCVVGAVEGRTVTLPELDGTGSRSGSVGREGPGTDGRGVVGLGTGAGPVGAGLVGVGAVSCGASWDFPCGARLAGPDTSPDPDGAVWCGWEGAVEGVRVEPVGCAGAAVPPPGRV